MLHRTGITGDVPSAPTIGDRSAMIRVMIAELVVRSSQSIRDDTAKKHSRNAHRVVREMATEAGIAANELRMHRFRLIERVENHSLLGVQRSKFQERRTVNVSDTDIVAKEQRARILRVYSLCLHARFRIHDDL